jgi:hypothetical protein
MTSLWLNDNAECDILACLWGLSYFAERVYDADADEEKLRARFAATTGGNPDAFFDMSLFHNSFGGEGDDYEGKRWGLRFIGKALLWQDVLEGLYDATLYRKPMSDHYLAAAQKMRTYLDGGAWDGLYEYAAKILDLLAEKTYIAERLRPAYQAGDRATLAEIADVRLPALAKKAQAARLAHRDRWFAMLKTIGWSNMDIRYSGISSRCETAELLIKRYLAGECDCIEGLDQARLSKGSSGFIHYSAIATVNTSI